MRNLDELLLLWHDRSISDEDFADLKQRLAHPESRARLAEDFLMTAVILDVLKVDAAASGIAPELPTVSPASRTESSVDGFSSRRSFHTLWVAAAVLLVAVGVSLWQRSDETTVLARLEQVAGQVFVTTSDTRDVGAAGHNLFSGQGLTVVGEESSAVVVYADGTRLLIDGDTTITELSGDRTSGKRIVLAEGNLRADVAKQPPEFPMIVHTPSAEVLVLGTRFDLSGDVKATYVETEEGLVRLTRASDGRSVEVPAGFDAYAGMGVEPFMPQPAPRFFTPRSVFPGYGAAAYSSDGTMLVTWRRPSKSVALWDAVSGRQRATLEGHERPVRVAAFSPDGKTLATGSADRTVKLWEAATGQLRSTLGPCADSVSAVAFTSDGKTLSIKAGAMVTRWDVATGQLRTASSWSCPSNRSAFSPDGETLVTDGEDGRTVTLWNLITGESRVVLRLEEKVQRAFAFGFSPDGKTLAVSGVLFVALCDIETGVVRNPFRIGRASVHSIAFSPDGRLVSLGYNGKALLFDLDTATKRAEFRWPGSEQQRADVRINSLAFSPDGRTLATGCAARPEEIAVNLWDVPDASAVGQQQGAK